MEEKGLRFVTHEAPGCPPHLVADHHRLAQVLRNLLSNAHKFTAEGSVSLMGTPAPTGGVRFTVSDTGVGIPAAQLQSIFDAFQQGDGTIRGSNKTADRARAVRHK